MHFFMELTLTESSKLLGKNLLRPTSFLQNKEKIILTEHQKVRGYWDHGQEMKEHILEDNRPFAMSVLAQRGR